MKPEDEIISELKESNIEYKLVAHPEETITAREKAQSLRREGIVGAGIIKSVVFRYNPDNRDDQKSSNEESKPKYIVASTLGGARVKESELRVEFGLSQQEAESLTLDGIALETVTGKRRGEIGPLIPFDHVDTEKIDLSIYFTRDLMREAQSNPRKLYDVPLNLRESLLITPANLWKVLHEKSPKYHTASEFEEQIPFEIIKTRIEPRPDGPYFAGTQVRFRGRDYELKHPGKSSCIAFPLPFESDDRGRVRVRLPLGYDRIEKSLSSTENFC